MNTAVASKSRVKITNNQPAQNGPASRRVVAAKKTPWGAIAFFILIVFAFAFLFSPNTPKNAKSSVQTEKSLNGFGNKVLAR